MIFLCRQRTESSNPDVRVSKRKVDGSQIPVVTSGQARAARNVQFNHGVEQHGFGQGFRGNGGRGNGGRMFRGGFRGQHDIHQGFSRGGFRGNAHGGARGGGRGGPHSGRPHGGSRGRSYGGWGNRGDSSWHSGYNRRNYDRYEGQEYLYGPDHYNGAGGAYYGGRGNGGRHLGDIVRYNLKL